MSDPTEPSHEPEAELERRLRKLLGEDEGEGAVVGEAPAPAPESAAAEPVDPLGDIDTHLKQIGERLDKSRRDHSMPPPPDWDYQRPTTARDPKADPHNYRGLGIGITAGYTLIGAMIAGWLVGWLFDLKSHGLEGQAFGALGGCIV